jgi:hypothetical protein
MDYKVCVDGAARVAVGAGLAYAGYTVAKGKTDSRLGAMILPKGTEKKVTWQRAAIGSALVCAGVFSALSKQLRK